MSVYRPKGSPFYQFDFQCAGIRFHGSTKCKSRREAEQVERTERARARESTKTAEAPMSLDIAIGRYWSEVGQHTANADGLWRDLERLTEHLRPDMLLTELRDTHIAGLVAWRRGHRVVRSPKRKLADCPLVSPATVNRTTTELLKRICRRAAKTWGVVIGQEPNWRSHMLRESRERVRELAEDESRRLDLAARPDYAPFFQFAGLSGLRLDECLLEWSEVNWAAKRIQKTGKDGKLVSAPITASVRAVLWPLRGHHPISVFTYVARRSRAGRVKGRRYPLTYSGVKTQWRRLRKRAGVVDLRFHDLRHDLATKLLRETGNLKLVQRALNHADIRSTMRYAHVLDADVSAALDRVAESRINSRNKARKAS